MRRHNTLQIYKSEPPSCQIWNLPKSEYQNRHDNKSALQAEILLTILQFLQAFLCTTCIISTHPIPTYANQYSTNMNMYIISSNNVLLMQPHAFSTSDPATDLSNQHEDPPNRRGSPHGANSLHPKQRAMMLCCSTANLRTRYAYGLTTEPSQVSLLNLKPPDVLIFCPYSNPARAINSTERHQQQQPDLLATPKTTNQEVSCSQRSYHCTSPNSADAKISRHRGPDSCTLTTAKDNNCYVGKYYCISAQTNLQTECP